MCQSKAAGGKRCDYADQVSNVRKKALYKYSEEWNTETLAGQAVEKWKNDNKDIVSNHLPDTMSFQASPNLKPIPSDLLTFFNHSKTDPTVGHPSEDIKALTKKLFDERRQWEQKLNTSEINAIAGYSITNYENINSVLRRTGIAKLMKKDRHLKEYIESGSIKRSIENLDSALAKAPKFDTPRKVYRFYKVPAGTTAAQFLDKYFIEGQSFKDRGYMSTTADPEFIMAHLQEKNKGKKNSKYIVMEMITKKGGSLQDEPETHYGSLQSFEHEVLLPRNSKFRILKTNKSQKFEFADNRDDLASRYISISGDPFRKGDRINFPVVQMIDETLIAESR